MVIVEGPDGGGKTHLAHRLADQFDLKYRRPPPELLSSSTGPSPGLSEWWRDQLRDPERHAVVYDRCFWISEPIYSSVTLRQPLVSGIELTKGILDLWVEGPMIVFCMTDEAAMLENTYYAGRPRLSNIQDDVRKMRAINFLYWSAFGTWAANLDSVAHWDYNAHEYASIVWLWGEYCRTKVG